MHIPYTIETIAIEFNRDIIQAALALNALIDLEMVEFAHNKIYKVKNFAKHENIKTKENVEIRSIVESKDIMLEVKNKEDKTGKNLENQRC